MPWKFLDAKVIYETSSITTNVYRKQKLLVHCSSQIPKLYNRNPITSDLKRAARVATVSFRVATVPGNEIPQIHQQCYWAIKTEVKGMILKYLLVYLRDPEESSFRGITILPYNLSLLQAIY